MNRTDTIRSTLSSVLKQRQMALFISEFGQSQLKNDIIFNPISKEFATNRYKILLENIRSFVISDAVQLDEVLSFAQKLFEVISNDMIVLQNNEKVIQQSIINQKNIFQLDKDLNSFKVRLIGSADEIRTYQQMLEFTGGIFSAYNKKLNQFRDIYDSISKIRISTTLEVETIYDPNVTEQFYDQYHSQLFNVLRRSKRSLESLVEDIKKSKNADMGAKCLTFLTSSKNLIGELQTFLIDKNCVFNRLLSYVVTLHQNNIDQFFNKSTDKIKLNNRFKEVIEKNFYMFKVFDSEIFKIEEQIKINKQELQAKFKAKNYIEVIRLAKQHQKQTLEYYETIKDIRTFISKIDEQYMKQLSRNLFNGKIKKAKETKEKVNTVDQDISTLAKLAQNDNVIKQTQVNLKMEGQKISRAVDSYINKLDVFTEEIFRKVYTQIQEKFIQICSIQQNLNFLNNHHFSYLKKNYIEQKLKIFSNLQESYFRTEKGLITLMQQYKQGYKQQTNKNINNADEVISKSRLCIEKLQPYQEGNIDEWKKSQTSRETRFLQLILHAKGQIERQMNNHIQNGMVQDPETLKRNKQVLAELQRLKINFESLMRCYDTLIHKNSLYNQISQLSFENKQQVQKQIEENQQSLEEINYYYKQLKENEKPQIRSELDLKVHQINKERLNVIDQVLSTFGCIFKVYAQVKSKQQPEQLRNGYVQVGNQKILDHLILLYVSRKEFLNRIKDINSNPKLHEKTKQFLSTILENLLAPLLKKTSMDQLQKYILCLEKTMDFGTKIQDLIAQMIKKIGNQKDQLYRGRLVGISRQIIQLKNSVEELDTLEDGPLGKIIFGSLKSHIKKINDYFLLAEQIIKEKSLDKMTLEIQLKDQKVSGLRNKIIDTLNN